MSEFKFEEPKQELQEELKSKIKEDDKLGLKKDQISKLESFEINHNKKN